MTEPYVPEDLARTLADDDLSHMTDMAGFSEPEQEKFLLIYGPRKVRKAVKDRRQGTRARAEERAEETERVISFRLCWASWFRPRAGSGSPIRRPGIFQGG